MSEFIGKDGASILEWKDYVKRANELRRNEKLKPKEIRDLLGNPVVNGRVVELTSAGPNTVKIRTDRGPAAARRTTKTSIYKKVENLPKEIQDWAKRLDKAGKWPEGKSLQGFIDSHKVEEKILRQQIKDLKGLGFIDEKTGRSLIDDGHLLALGTKQPVNHPLRKKGTHGAHFAEARVPELAEANQGKAHHGDRDFLDAKRAGIATDDLDAFSQYLTGDTGVGTKLTTSQKQRWQYGASPDQLVESQIKAGEIAKQNHVWRDMVESKAGKALSKVSGKLSKADLIAQTATGVATGNVIQAGAAGTTLAASQALQHPAVQKRIAKQTAELIAKRGAKSAAKLIPGLDIAMSGMEAWGYLSQGKLDQAGIAALSGAIGWIPVIGDGAAAALDLSNTGIDIARLNLNQSPDIDMTEGGKVSKYESGVMHSPTGQGDEAFDNVVNALKENPSRFDSSGFGNRMNIDDIGKALSRL